MRRIFLVFICFFAVNVFAQTRYADSLKNLLEEEGSPTTRFDLINKILEDEVNSGANMDTALFVEMLRSASNLRNDSLLAISYNMAGSYNARKGDYPAALEYLFKAIPLAEKAPDKRRISSLYFDISLVYIILKNMKEAIYYNLKGRDNLPDKSTPVYDFMVAQFDRNMVRYYLLKNMPDSALSYAQHLVKEGIIVRKPVIRLPSLFLAGAVYAELNKNDSAELYFTKAANLADSINSIGLKWTNDKYLIPYLLKADRIQEAKDRASLLFNLGEKNNNWDVKLSGAGFLRTVFEKMNQPDSAYYFSLKELAIKDSVFNENNINKEQVLAFNEKLRKIEEQSQLEIRQREAKQKIVLGLITFGIIMLIILFLSQLRKRRKEMEHKLASQRDRISRELHDNVGSQLSYITGNIDWLIDSKGFLSPEEEAKKLSIVSETSKNIVSDLRETIWVIKKESIRLDELSDKLKSHLQEQVEVYPEIEVEITEDIKKNYDFLPTESLNTYRICQEAINNIVKHAEATKIVLKIISDKDRDYLFTISDNGKGFDAQIQKEGHYGLVNMTQRAKETGAILSIHAEPGHGTTVTLFKSSKQG